MAQNLSISKFSEASNDLTARIKPVKDNNGQVCGLVKIVCLDEITKIEGNVLHSAFNGNEHWVYLTPGTKRIRVLTRHHSPIDISFAEHMNHSVAPQTTYMLELVSDLPPDVLYGSSDPSKPVALSKENDALLPPWWNSIRKDQYIGISVPTFNGMSAKSLAVNNAVAQYVHAKGDYVEYRGVNDAFSDGSHITQVYRIVSGGFSLGILQEYYNSKGEYFVLCDITKDESSHNRFSCSWDFDSYLESGGLTLSFALDTREDQYKFGHIIDYKCMWVEDSVVFNINLNGKELLNQNLSLAHMKDDYSELRIYGSPGLAQLRLLSSFPCLPDSLEIKGRSYIGSTDGFFTSAYEFVGKGFCQPHKYKISDIDYNNTYCNISIDEKFPDYNFTLADLKKDQSQRHGLSENYFRKYDSNRDVLLSCMGYCDSQNPLMERDKNFAFMGAMPIMILSSSSNPNISEEDSEKDNPEYKRFIEAYKKLTTANFTVYPLWLMDAENRVPYTNKDWEENRRKLWSQMILLYKKNS